jgi:anaerobic selenocysteine-containing dehydrogenase
MARWNHKISLPSGTKLPQTRRFNQLWKRYDINEARSDILQLTTFRSQGQFNTTVYSDRDRFRGISGTRMVLFMNQNDIVRLELNEGDIVSLKTAVGDDATRRVDGFVVQAYNIPEGCLGGYYPECNPLILVWRHAKGSFVPAAKGVPVRVEKDARPT